MLSERCINLPETSYVLSKDQFAKIIGFVRNFYKFCKICLFYFDKENNRNFAEANGWPGKNQQSTRDRFEISKNHSSYCNRPTNSFYKVCIVSIPENSGTFFERETFIFTNLLKIKRSHGFYSREMKKRLGTTTFFLSTKS